MKFTISVFTFIFLIILSIFLYSILVTPIYKEIDITSIVLKEKEELNKNQDIVIFDSKNPFNFHDIFNNIDNLSNQKVYGILTKPQKEGIFPIIIGVAGSDGWDDHHYGYLERYLDSGFAVFSLHSFKSRNVTSTVGSQLAVTMPMMIYDSFMALKELNNNKFIDTKRAGITGWSLGGGVSIFTAWTPIQEFLSPGLKFAAHRPFYPPCMIIPDDFSFTDSPIHILAGELDGWVPAGACKDFVEIAKQKKYDISITVYSGASHSFDRNTPIVLNEKA